MNIFGEQKELKIGVTININPNDVKVFKAWMGTINIDYPVKEIKVVTSLGQERTINFDHHRYQIHEGKHNVPLKNRMDFSDLRGDYMNMEITIESKENKNINVFSFVNFVRKSNL